MASDDAELCIDGHQMQPSWPSKKILKVFHQLDEDDFVSMVFLLNGISSEFCPEDFDGQDLIGDADILTKARSYECLRPNDSDVLISLLKEILYVIKRFDLLHSHFNVCEHIMANEQLKFIDPNWKKLFTVYDNVAVTKQQQFRQFLQFDAKEKLFNLLIARWFKETELPTQKKFELLASLLEKIGEGKIANKILEKESESYYPMDHSPCGIAVIFNQIHFDDKSLGTREGTNIDRDKLESVFKSFGFEILICNDYDSEEINDTLDKIAERNHEHYDCFVCCVLSHGYTGNFLAKDGKPISISGLRRRFSSTKVPSLSGKPKLFIIQACQGKKYEGAANTCDIDNELETDSFSSSEPETADVMMALATHEGYASMRHCKNGSWYIETLYEVLNELGHKEDITVVLRTVNYRVSNYAGVIHSDDTGAVKNVRQMPFQHYSLRKHLQFKKRSSY